MELPVPARAGLSLWFELLAIILLFLLFLFILLLLSSIYGARSVITLDFLDVLYQQNTTKLFFVNKLQLIEIRLYS